MADEERRTAPVTVRIKQSLVDRIKTEAVVGRYSISTTDLIERGIELALEELAIHKKRMDSDGTV